jgi:hypothetical protein
MKGRHEVKHYISLADYYELRARLRAVLRPDPHAGADGQYLIRSLYFDNADDRALQEKLDGIKNRDKYRIRYYNRDTSFIQLEKKSKRENLCVKKSAPVTAGEAQAIVDGDIEWMEESDHELIRELHRAMMEDGMKPRTIVDYQRDPFIYDPGNVRITLDHDIRTGISGTDFLDPDCITIPIAEDAIILEVKWDNFLPDIVRDVVQVPNRRASAFSKYAACRVYDF